MTKKKAIYGIYRTFYSRPTWSWSVIRLKARTKAKRKSKKKKQNKQKNNTWVSNASLSRREAVLSSWDGSETTWDHRRPLPKQC
jgi:hypothetical protein